MEKLFANKLPSEFLTYSGKGVAKAGVKKNEHAIAYTCGQPEVLLGEEPRPGEPGMQPAIRVVPHAPENKFDRTARLKYRGLVTIPHDTPVELFGCIHEESQASFGRSVNSVFKFVPDVDLIDLVKANNVAPEVDLVDLIMADSAAPEAIEGLQSKTRRRESSEESTEFNHHKRRRGDDQQG